MSTKLYIGHITTACLVIFTASSFAQSLDDYRTNASGNWTDPTIWQRYNGTTWVAAASAPAAAIANVITVRSPHTVTANNVSMDQTIVEQGATVNQTGNVVIDNGTGIDLLINGTWNLNTSSTKLFGANATVTVNGEFNLSNGIIGDNNTPLIRVIVASNGVVNLSGSGNKVIERAQLVNNGIINWSDGSLFTHQTVNFDTSRIINNGTWNINTTGALNTYGQSNTYFINGSAGTINKNGSGSITTQQGTYFVNEGILNVNDGTFSTDNQNASFHNYNNINISSPGIFHAAWNVNLYNGSTLSGNGIFNATGAVIVQSGTATAGSNLNVNLTGGYLTGAGTFLVTGTMNWTNGVIGGPNYVYNGLARTVIDSGAVLNITGTNNKVIERAQLTNNGTINWEGGSLYTNQTVNADTCKLINNGTWNINNGAIDFWGQGNTYYINGTNGTIIKNTTGSNTMQYNAAFVNEGLVKGIGTFVLHWQSGYQNSGTYNPGLSPGKLNIHDKNPLTPQGNLLIELQNASGAGIGHDLLEINGSITLSGKLTVVETGSVPAGTYTIINLSSGTVSSSFDVVDLPPYYIVGTTASTVYITKAQVYFTTVNDTICNGQSYSFGGQLLTNTGTYKDTLVATDGADSIVTLHLFVETVTATATQNGNTLTAGPAGNQYQWFDCSTNQHIAGATSQSFTPAQTGSYAVIVTTPAGCTDTSACTNVTIVGVDEIVELKEWKIYPNPSANEFSIFTNHPETFEIYDLTGKMLDRFFVNENKPLAYRHTLPQGVYVLRGKERRGMKKIIVQ